MHLTWWMCTSRAEHSINIISMLWFDTRYQIGYRFSVIRLNCCLFMIVKAALHWKQFSEQTSNICLFPLSHFIHITDDSQKSFGWIFCESTDIYTYNTVAISILRHLVKNMIFVCVHVAQPYAQDRLFARTQLNVNKLYFKWIPSSKNLPPYASQQPAVIFCLVASCLHRKWECVMLCCWACFCLSCILLNMMSEQLIKTKSERRLFWFAM